MMTLRLKINLIVGALMVVFLGAVVALQLRGVRESVNEEVVAANRVAHQMLTRTALQAAQGTPSMLAFLQGMGRIRSNDVTLLGAGGEELYRSPPSPYKTGRDAPAWFERLVAPPPTVQSIAFPDGKLVVQANASRAVLDAWDDLRQFGLAALAFFVAVNGLVFWLVGRAVKPFPRIVGALDELQHGRFDATLPPLPGREAAAIGVAFNRMVGVLRTHIETERRAARAEAQLSESRELARWMERHIEQERRLIARELHDEFGQSVTAIRSMALSVAQRCAAAHDAESAGAARLIADESSRLYDAMHGIIPRLTPPLLDRLGLAEALTDLVERTRASHGELQIETRIALGDTPLAPEAALAIYRAAQEGLTNAIRHGDARHVTLAVDVAGAEVGLDLADDGRGLPPEGVQREGHYGLRWLGERVAGLGGRLRVEPREPHGVRLQVTLPLAGAAA
jgi:two-component system, NarL family, sensor histidine kinase UhpB